jgi:hypothetical protein
MYAVSSVLHSESFPSETISLQPGCSADESEAQQELSDAHPPPPELEPLPEPVPEPPQEPESWYAVSSVEHSDESPADTISLQPACSSEGSVAQQSLKEEQSPLALTVPVPEPVPVPIPEPPHSEASW